MNLRNSSEATIALIGAGIAGVTCARRLRQKGYHPTIFEKSRGLGGRLANRRLADGIAFDHGAQYITAHSATFQSVVKEAIEAGSADHWCPRVLNRSRALTGKWIVGTPTMNALMKPLAHGIDIRLKAEVTSVDREDDSWVIRTLTRDAGEPFDVVISSAPAPRARALLSSEPAIAEALAQVSIAPCWALMFTYAGPIEPGFDVWRSASDDLAWISRNNSKPRRRALKDCWVVHGSPEWSERYLELDGDQAAKMMIEKLPVAFGARRPEIEYVSVHRWRYALTTAPLGEPYLCSNDRTLFVGGDWCLGARIECAFESGNAMADAVIDAAKD